MSIEELNNLPKPVFLNEMKICCASSRWMNEMYSLRPFSGMKDLMEKADKAWQSAGEEDWLEAFSHHPKIGDLESLEKKFNSTKELAGLEQSSVKTATSDTLQALADGNKEYEKKFGFIFIVCATGKSADEMLQLLNNRIVNNRAEEIRTAAAEQHKITILRLKKIIS